MNPEIVDLKNNPLFIMSLHSKELFHSNFWAWLFERNVEYAKEFFPELEMIDKDGVKREEKNRDITIWSDGKAYVIENKLKSIPRLLQIQGYQEDLKDKFAKGVLTGIVEPDFINLANGWSFKSYEEISDCVKKVANKFEEDGFEKKIIIEYSIMLSMLNKLIKSFIEQASGKWVTYLDYSELETIRMDDIVKKLIASSFVSFLNKKFDIGKAVGDYKLETKDDFSNKQAIVEVKYEFPEANDKVSIIGIQVQDNQFRWFIQINEKLDDEKLKRRFEEYQQLGWFEKYDKESKLIGNKKTCLREEYCKYRTGKYTFIYQYWNISDNIEPTYENIAAEITKSISKAEELIRKDFKM